MTKSICFVLDLLLYVFLLVIWFEFIFFSKMDISLKDEIVVLDEAHNIEDSAREAASVSITSLQLEDVMVELDRLGK